MKLIALGDTHGRTNWEQIVSTIKFDKIVFIGDYFDTHEDISPEQQKLNFKNLIKYKNKNKRKVVLLFGNHDYHYLKTVNESYSGFQPSHKMDFQKMLHKALDNDLMEMCFKHENYLFSHAGITQTWLNNTGYNGEKPLDLFINNFSNTSQLSLPSGANDSPYGEDICQHLLVRPQTTQGANRNN